MNSQNEPRLPDPVGAKYSGKWIAWDNGATKIVASGETIEEVRQEAMRAGILLPGLEFVPPTDRAFVGGL